MGIGLFLTVQTLLSSVQTQDIHSLIKAKNTFYSFQSMAELLKTDNLQ